MAIWQYDFMVVPRDELAEALGTLPKRMTTEQFSHMQWWQAHQPVAGYQDLFSKWRPQIESWMPELHIWGDEQSDRIDVTASAGGHVRHIEFRFELRSINIRFVTLISDFARKSNCVLVSAHSMSVVEPLRRDILTHLAKSPGANNVWDQIFGGPSSGSSKYHPKLFLSHSSMDKSFVSRLAVDLASRKVPVWFDSWELKVGDSLTTKIAEGIEGSGYLAVVLSKSSVKSPWVQKELNAGLALELRNRNVFVLPILLDDCERPIFLLDKVYADFRISYESGFSSLMDAVVD